MLELIILFIILILIIIFVLQQRRKYRKYYEKQKRKYQKEICSLKKQSKISKNKSKEYCELGRKYHYGFADHYYNGKLVKGIKPDINKAKQYYHLSILLGNYSCALELASIYHWGISGQCNQDIKKAELIYNFLLKFGDISTQNIAKDRLDKLINHFQNENTIIIENENEEDPVIIEETEEFLEENNINARHRNDDNILIEPLDLEILLIDRFNFNMIPIEPIGFIETDLQDNIIRNDSQNIHNSGINKTLVESIKKLKNVTIIKINSKQTIEELTELINIYPISHIRKVNALKVLNDIKNNNELHVSSKMREIDILTLVYNRINELNKKNIKGSGNLLENLINELSECIEYGSSVCVSGRITHIIDTLNTIDPEVELKPQWVLSQEMLDKANKIYNDYIEKLSNEDKILFEDLIDSNDVRLNERYNKLSKELKKIIIVELRKDYVVTNLMSEELFNNELSKWIDHIW